MTKLVILLAAVTLVACADATAPTVRPCTLSRPLGDLVILYAKNKDCGKLNLDSLVADGWTVTWP